MARLPRINLPNVTQHVLLRGNNKGQCFFHEKDFEFFLQKLLDTSQHYNVRIHSYILMPNHVHLLLTPCDVIGISRLIQSLGRSYVRYINTYYDRSGTLWEGRYKSVLIDSKDYLLLISRYIELNPVRAKLVDHPSNYKWSSYHKNALGIKNKIITPHRRFQSLGNKNILRQKAYCEFFNDEIDDLTLENIRYSINKSWVMGDEKFKSMVEEMTGRRVSPIKRGGDRKSKKYLNSKQIPHN